MRRALRAGLVSVLAIFLGISTQVKAQVQGSPTSTTVEVGSQKDGRTSSGASTGNVEKRNPVESGESNIDEGARGKGKPSDGAGYTWSEKRSSGKSKSSPLKVRVDPNRPLADSPNFEMRSDGTSVVTVSLSRPTNIIQQSVATKKKSNLRAYVLLLKQAQVGVKNNTNPLITAHFQTPLERVTLRHDKQGAVLRLEFREDVQVTHTVKVGPHGSVLVEIVIPKPSKTYSSIATPKPKSTEIDSLRNDFERSTSMDER
jgi:hypothetical protein